MWELQTPHFPSYPLHNKNNLTSELFPNIWCIPHTHTTQGGICSNYNHTKPSHIQWDEYLFLQGILWQRKGPVCANVRVLMCLLFCDYFYGWARSNESERNRHLQIPSYALCLIAFLSGVSSVVKRRKGVNRSQSVIPGWRSFLSTLKPCVNKTPGQYQDHPSINLF